MSAFNKKFNQSVIRNVELGTFVHRFELRHPFLTKRSLVIVIRLPRLAFELCFAQVLNLLPTQIYKLLVIFLLIVYSTKNTEQEYSLFYTNLKVKFYLTVFLLHHRSFLIHQSDIYLIIY